MVQTSRTSFSSMVRLLLLDRLVHRQTWVLSCLTRSRPVSQPFDVAVFATALTINDTNLADVISYLDANSNNNGVVGFLFDSTGNGANDSTMIYHNAAGSATNSLVQLSGTLTATEIVVAQGTGANDIVAL